MYRRSSILREEQEVLVARVALQKTESEKLEQAIRKAEKYCS